MKKSPFTSASIVIDNQIDNTQLEHSDDVLQIGLISDDEKDYQTLKQLIDKFNDGQYQLDWYRPLSTSLQKKYHTVIIAFPYSDQAFCSELLNNKNINIILLIDRKIALAQSLYPSFNLAFNVDEYLIKDELLELQLKTSMQRWQKQHQLNNELIKSQKIALSVAAENSRLLWESTVTRIKATRYSKLFDSDVMGILYWTSDGYITEANDTFLQMVGYDHEDILCKRLRWAEMTPPEYLERDRHILKEIYLTGRCLPFEKEFYHKEGNRVPVLVGGAALDEEFKNEGYCFIIENRERKQQQEELEARLRQQAVIAELGQLALTGTKEQKLLEIATKLLSESLGVEYSSIWEFVSEKQQLRLKSGLGWPKNKIGQLTVNIHDNSLMKYALVSTKPFLIFQQEYSPKDLAALLLSDIKTGLCANIPGFDQKFGVLSVFTRKLRNFSEGDQLFLSTIANIIAVAASRRWVEENRERLLNRIISAQEQERRWIARELHDEAGQSLMSLLMGLKMLEKMKNADEIAAQTNILREVTSHTLTALKRLARGLHPSVLDDLGLDVALNRYASDYSRSHDIKVNINTDKLSKASLRAEVEIAIYRVVQEALTNTAKYANAQTVDIIFERNDEELKLIVKDDGCGFDVETVLRSSASCGSLGLYSMRERAALLGGIALIRSNRNKGTTITMRVPLKSQHPIEEEIDRE